MIFTLIRHSWLAFRRSAFFEKSIGMQAVMAFVFFIILMQISALGKVMPGILNQAFPERSPGHWVYGFWLLLMAMDLITRLFFQKMPSAQVTPYLHFPVSRGVLATYWLLRSWLTPFNVYLLIFFIPFIRRTVNPETSSQGLAILGILLFTAVMHAVLVLVRSGAARQVRWLIYSLPVLVLGSYVLAFDLMMEASFNLILAMAKGNLLVQLLPFVFVLSLQGLAWRYQKSGYYQAIADPGLKGLLPGAGWIERRLAQVPVYGPYWLLEWRLVLRNNRSRSNFFTIMLMGVALMAYLAWRYNDGMEGLMVIVFMVAGGYGVFHLQHAFSWESRYFDGLLARPFSVEMFIRAKYYFYVGYALLQWLLITLVLAFININVWWLYTGMMLYACGPAMFVYLRLGITNSGRFDPNGKANFNFEGVSGMKMLVVMLLYFSILPFFFLGYFLSIPQGTALSLGVAGLAFVLTHRLWIRSLGKRFLTHKYQNLERYRQK